MKLITDQVSMYHSLRLLMEEPNVGTFEQLLESVIDQMKADEGLKQFYQYFESIYCSRCEQWALCHRKAAGINTNMYTEYFHRVLKHVYMKGKVNKRMHAIIHLLLK